MVASWPPVTAIFFEIGETSKCRREDWGAVGSGCPLPYWGRGLGRGLWSLPWKFFDLAQKGEFRCILGAIFAVVLNGNWLGHWVAWTDWWVLVTLWSHLKLKSISEDNDSGQTIHHWSVWCVHQIIDFSVNFFHVTVTVDVTISLSQRLFSYVSTDQLLAVWYVTVSAVAAAASADINMNQQWRRV